MGRRPAPDRRAALGRPTPTEPGPGQESVWDYPRPPAVEASDAVVIVEFGGIVVAWSSRTLRVLETSHAPVHYVPRGDVRPGVLRDLPGGTWCEFKGAASYADLVVGDARSRQACWWYPSPHPDYDALAGAVAFYPGRVDRITVDGEEVRSMEGDFYGGWITSKVVGPFKGAPGTEWW